MSIVKEIERISGGPFWITMFVLATPIFFIAGIGFLNMPIFAISICMLILISVYQAAEDNGVTWTDVRHGIYNVLGLSR